ncbi:hypothetical protein ACFL0T_05055 [Candidatus Omnitrophota bacterium]
MSQNNKRRAKIINSALQRKLLLLVFFAAVIPASIVTICLYYVIFNMLARQLGIPEAIAYNLLPVARKVNMIIIVSLPISLIVIWFIALELSHRIAGPIYRLEKELDDRIEGKKSGPVNLRAKDELKSLVEKINRLLLS